MALMQKNEKKSRDVARRYQRTTSGVTPAAGTLAVCIAMLSLLAMLPIMLIFPMLFPVCFLIVFIGIGLVIAAAGSMLPAATA